MEKEKNKEKVDVGASSPVQEYVGQDKYYVDSEESAETVEKNEKEIRDLAVQYMKNVYKTEVNVIEVYPAQNAAVVYVESTQEPIFQTSVIVPVNSKEQTLVGIDEVYSMDGKVEGAILGGLYHMAYEEEFKVLDEFIQAELEKYPVAGITKESLHLSDDGYKTPYYYINITQLQFPEVFSAYMGNQNITSSELRELFEEANQQSENSKAHVYICLYMTEKYQDADKEVADSIINDFNELQGVAPGKYYINIYPNLILHRNGQGVTKEGNSNSEGTGGIESITK